MENALYAARDLGMDCVQVFTKNQKKWKTKPLAPDQIDRWFAAMDQTGIREVVSHDSYLINLATPDEPIRSKSLTLFEEEMRRCDQLAIPYLVTHPGAHKGIGEEAGLELVAQALDLLHAKLPDAKVTTCLEVTAGQGTSLGASFEHLRAIIDQVAEPDRLAVCLDTAHLLAAGYDLTSKAGMQKTLRQCDQVLGLDLVKVIHINDSKTPRGSRVDRHAHIGHGHVSEDAFAVLLKRRNLRHVPMILETEKAEAPDGRPWDAINLDALKMLRDRKLR